MKTIFYQFLHSHLIQIDVVLGFWSTLVKPAFRHVQSVFFFLMGMWFLLKKVPHILSLPTQCQCHVRTFSHRTDTDPWTVGNLSLQEESEVKAADLAHANLSVLCYLRAKPCKRVSSGVALGRTFILTRQAEPPFFSLQLKVNSICSLALF